MARPTKQPQFEPPGFHQSPRAKFIKFALTQNSPALRLLGTSVWRGEMSPENWAKQFNVSGTWVEQWAQDALDSWHASALTASGTDGASKTWSHDPIPSGFRSYRPDRLSCTPPLVLESGKLDMEYPLPRASETDFPTPWTQTNGLFESGACEQRVAPIGIECPHCGRKVTGKRRKLRKRLDDETATLDSKIECAAVYVLSAETREQLAKRSWALTESASDPSRITPVKSPPRQLDF
jgi:hypothetical protein